MANIRAHVAGPAQTNLSVEVRAVQIHLPTVGVNDFANLLDRFLEHTVSAWISNHQSGQIIFMCLGLRAQISDIDVPFLIASHGNYLQPGHHRAGRVSAMR